MVDTPFEQTNNVERGALTHPGFGGLVNFEQRPLSTEPDTAIAETLAAMNAYARQDAEAESIQRIARSLQRSNAKETAAAIFDWTKRKVRFSEDKHTAAPIRETPELYEVLIRPVDLLAMPQPAGDCDDFAMLTAALLMAAGIPASFKTVAADSKAPDQFSHVYTVATLPCGKRLAMDTSHGPNPGWEVPGKRRRQEWPIMPLRKTLGLVPIESPSAPWWQAPLQTGLQIASARYGQAPAGTTIQRASDGSVFYSRQDPFTPAGYFPPISPVGDNSMLWIVGGLAVGGLILSGMLRK